MKIDTAFTDRITALHKRLGIPPDYATHHGLQPCLECGDLVSIGQDIFDREQWMEPRAAKAWSAMQTAAAADRVDVQVVSAYRSIEYQASIFQKKLESGQCMGDILQVSAAPGFSEHHSGRAMDLSTPGFEPLEDIFERSKAFEWLRKNAKQFGFRMSFPRDNPHGLCYEPWHWCWVPSDSDQNLV